jgi:hypothetical protein
MLALRLFTALFLTFSICEEQNSPQTAHFHKAKEIGQRKSPLSYMSDLGNLKSQSSRYFMYSNLYFAAPGELPQPF